MTTIAWDGKSLAADTLMNEGNAINYGTKIKYFVGDYGAEYLAVTGDMGMCFAMMEWWVNGGSIDNFPKKHLSDHDHARLLVFRPNKPILSFVSSPYPVKLTDKFYAAGSGRDFAIAAMHCGKSAKEAVEIACLYDLYSGGEVDALEVV